MHEYRARSSPLEANVSSLPKKQKWQTLDEQYGLADMFDEPFDLTTTMSLDEEFAAFVNAPLSPKGTSLLQYLQVHGVGLFCHNLYLSIGQMNEHSLMTWFAIALNYLPIQASAVPSERVFSSSAQTDTAHCNRINPILMESLQMLKFGLFNFSMIFFVS